VTNIRLATSFRDQGVAMFRQEQKEQLETCVKTETSIPSPEKVATVEDAENLTPSSDPL
jgi:hypothetical protein